MPFYGYDFTNQNDVYGRTYNTIVGLDADNAYRDQYGDIYYNGIPTIRMKTEYALAQVSGVMIWELGQDHYGEFSLLDQVDDVIQSATSSTNNMVDVSMTIYPNPFIDKIQVLLNQQADMELILLDMHGRIILNEEFSGLETTIKTPTGLPPGMYVLQLISNGRVSSHKLLKR
jgi:hypothetical protein